MSLRPDKHLKLAAPSFCGSPVCERESNAPQLTRFSLGRRAEECRQ